jgi:GT2 family glycosyltransferase
LTHAAMADTEELGPEKAERARLVEQPGFGEGARIKPVLGNRRQRPAHATVSSDGTLRTTVVIPAYRAESTLPAVLDALAPQLGPDREALLVDSGTENRSSQLDGRWPWLRVIAIPHRAFPGKARNVGAAEARGEFLAFLDADTVPCADWLDRLEEALTGDVDAVAGAILNGTLHSRIGTAQYLLEFSEGLPRRPRQLRFAGSGNLLVRREWFQAVGGFRDTLRAGEDTVFTFPLASQRRLAFAADATVRHLNRTELAPFLANQRVQGAAFVAICRLVPYPHRWVVRGPALLLAGPLRLMALARCLLYNRSQFKHALLVLPELLLGTAAWTAGAFEARHDPLQAGGKCATDGTDRPRSGA